MKNILNLKKPAWGETMIFEVIGKVIVTILIIFCIFMALILIMFLGDIIKDSLPPWLKTTIAIIGLSAFLIFLFILIYSGL